jgi:hypothetical protein
VAVTTNGSRMVDDVSDPHPVRDELSVASDAGEAVGGGLLAVRGGDNGLCNAGACKVDLCICGQPKRDPIPEGSHYVTPCCRQTVSNCCGDDL